MFLNKKNTTSVFVIISIIHLICYANLALAALVPDYYSEQGLNPHRDYVHQHFSEYIDPHTGKLQLHYIDMFIPSVQ